MTNLKVVSISPQLPSVNSESAGGRLVASIARVIGGGAELLFMVPLGGANQRAVEVGVPFDYRWVEPRQILDGRRRFLPFRGSSWQPVIRRMLELNLIPSWGQNIFRNKDLLQRIQEADVVDLQWQEQGALIPAIRAVNPSARIVCVFHDVLSQKFERNAISSQSRIRKFYWRVAEQQARRLEKRIVRDADRIVVLSEKDRDLLPGSGRNVVIVRPEPARFDGACIVRDPEPKLLLFVGFLARFENEDAIVWFMDEILPMVRRVHPDVRVKVAGRGIRPHVQENADRSGVSLLDFVEDLAPLYSQASCMVVPLRHGAGVKFKVVDAIANGVPVVTTSVGAEGIFENGKEIPTFDDADSFAHEVIRKLNDQSAAEIEARSLAKLFFEDSDSTEYSEIIRSIYF